MRFPTLLLFAGIAAASSLPAQNAKDIIESARLQATLQQNDLQGEIRKGREKTNVALFLRGQNIQFQYSKDGAPWQAFHMRLGDGQFELFEFIDRKQRRFSNEKLAQPLAGTDLTYEDLSMRYFYWPDPKLEGEERVKTFECYKIRLDNPGRAGAYRTVYVWVHKKYRAFMKVEGFDRNGNKLKQFLVDDVMKLRDGTYTLKEMEVSTWHNGRVASRSELKFDPPKAPQPRGGR